MSFPIGYLFTLAVLLICTTAALLPVRPSAAPGRRIRFFLTVVVNEVPQLAGLWLMLATLLAWVEGDLTGGTGLLLLPLAALVLLGLVVLTLRGLRARGAVDATVRAHGMAPRHRPGSRLRAVLFPFARRPVGVKRSGPLFYGDHPRQRLDVYRSRRPAHPGPVLVYFHGGGYSSGGNRREGRALLHHLAGRGWVCISATYRLRPEAGFADHLDDARAVLRWAHQHAEAHGGDPSTVVMAGSSAGAHLTALSALTQEAGNPQRPRVDAAVCLYSWYGRYYGRGPDESPPSTPVALDPAGAPPFFIAHGDHDSWVPVGEARALHRHLAGWRSNEIWYAELPGAQHGFDAFQSWRTEAVLEGLDAFLDQVPSRGDASLPNR